MLEEHDEAAESTNVSIIAAALAGLGLLASTVIMIVVMICLKQRGSRTDENYVGCVDTAQCVMTIFSAIVFTVVVVDTTRWIKRYETMDAWSDFDDCLVDPLAKVQEADMAMLEDAKG